MAEAHPLHWLAEADEEDLERFVATLDPTERRELRWTWAIWGRASQVAPTGEWRVWLIMAGRGFGKTRIGAEWVNTIAEENPDARIALIAASLGEARAIMVEGESGLLSVGAPCVGQASSPRCAGSSGPMARRLRSIRPVSRKHCAALSTAMPGATRSASGAMPVAGPWQAGITC